MTQPSSPRKPRAFSTDDPGIVSPPGGVDLQDLEDIGPLEAFGEIRVRPTVQELRSGMRWGGLFLAAMSALAGLAASLAFARFVSTAMERQDWIGWTAFGLAVTALVAAAVLVLRELIGLVRLRRLGRLRKDVDAALNDKDKTREREAVVQLQDLFAGRHDIRWGLARLAEHAGDVRDPGELLRLADRELLVPLDLQARRAVLKSAKRVATITALSPMAWIAMLYVLIENLGMMRALAGLYGGRPGIVGAFRLFRLVIGHIIATGGVAMTDDLLGQFLGQDLLRRLSRRLGEGAFNGALTARLGVAAIEVTRPLPFLDAQPIRVRDLLPELFRRAKTPAV